MCSHAPSTFRLHLLDPPPGRVGARAVPARFLSSPEGRTLATYLTSALHELCGKPIPAPLQCHSVGRGTSVPIGNTDACRWTDCVSGREPATVGTWRQTTTRKGSTEATKQRKNF